MNYQTQIELLRFARTSVRDAGKMLSEDRSLTVTRQDKYGGDLVTEGDLKVQDYLHKLIKKRFAHHKFLSEEQKANDISAEFVWILDPIDGTKHFVKGNPLYSISLALKYRGELNIGAVYVPMLNQLFSAAAGRGATLNRRKIRCSKTERLQDSIICLEIPSRHSAGAKMDRALETMKMLIYQVQRARIIGISSIGLCWTAMGAFDAYINLSRTSELWDIAAGRVILEEAGAKYVQTEGWIIAAPPKLQEKLVKIASHPRPD